MLSGNQYSHGVRFIDWLNTDPRSEGSKWLGTEFTLDGFAGLLFGDFPYHSAETYKADVHSIQVSGSLNLTARFRVQLLDFVRLEWEFEFVPLIAKVGIDAYTTSVIGDNCVWGYYNWHTLQMNTRFTKNIKRCHSNIAGAIQRSDGVFDIFSAMSSMPLASQVVCEFDDLVGKNV